MGQQVIINSEIYIIIYIIMKMYKLYFIYLKYNMKLLIIDPKVNDLTISKWCNLNYF